MEIINRKVAYDIAIQTLRALIKSNIIDESDFDKYEQKIASKYKFKKASILRSNRVDK